MVHDNPVISCTVNAKNFSKNKKEPKLRGTFSRFGIDKARNVMILCATTRVPLEPDRDLLLALWR